MVPAPPACKASRGTWYCLRFGGDVTFKPDKKWRAKNAPAPRGCPPSAE